MMEALTVFDAIVVVLLIVSTLMALSRGFMRELVTMGAFIAAIAAGYYARRFFRDDLAGLLPEGTADWVPDVILFVGLFLIVYILIAWFGASLSKSIQGVEGVDVLDRLAGAIFGFVRGVLVLVFFVFLMDLALEPERIPEWIRKSQSYPLLVDGAAYLQGYVPQVTDSLEQNVPLDEGRGTP